jgi:[acyl-carrier-protein] S-malonyltransferase
VSRAAVAFPGRGSYTPSSLGSLPAGHPWVRRADQLRAERDLPALSAIDGAPAFDPAVHLRPLNAFPLAFLASLLDADRIAADNEVVVVVASSTGWYTSLAASGVLGFDDAFRLVQEMAAAADEALPGGVAEIVYPLTDETWRPAPRLEAAVASTVAALDGAVHRAQELGGFTVVAGPTDAIAELSGRLDPVTVAGRSYPLRLAPADGWHTPLRSGAAEAAVTRLGDLGWQRPGVTLIDGRGARFTPWSTDPRSLAEYTLLHHPRTTYDFASGVRVALREFAPESILLPGPGATLGAPCARIIVADGYRGIRSRDDFEATQAGSSPVLLSVRR